MFNFYTNLTFANSTIIYVNYNCRLYKALAKLAWDKQKRTNITVLQFRKFPDKKGLIRVQTLFAGIVYT